MARTLISAAGFAAGWLGALCLAELVIAMAVVAFVSGVTLAEFLTILAIAYPSPAASRDAAEAPTAPPSLPTLDLQGLQSPLSRSC